MSGRLNPGEYAEFKAKRRRLVFNVILWLTLFVIAFNCTELVERATLIALLVLHAAYRFFVCRRAWQNEDQREIHHE